MQIAWSEIAVKVSKNRRVWIEDFEIAADECGRQAAQIMLAWKAERKRPTRFIQAVRLLQAVLEGDIDNFFDVLFDIDHRFARKIQMRVLPSTSQFNFVQPAPEPAPDVPVTLEIEAVTQTPDEMFGSMLGGLGLDTFAITD